MLKASLPALESPELSKETNKESVKSTSRSSSVVERFLGKEEVTSPTLVCGSLFMRKQKEKTTETEDESLVPALFERERK